MLVMEGAIDAQVVAESILYCTSTAGASRGNAEARSLRYLKELRDSGLGAVPGTPPAQTTPATSAKGLWVNLVLVRDSSGFTWVNDQIMKQI
jgi:hypothetical protein